MDDKAMCLSVISNLKRSVFGCNFDISMMDARVTSHEDGVFIEALDATEGWLPLFGAGPDRIFVTMPTCWPCDGRSNPRMGDVNVVNVAADLLLGKRKFSDAVKLAENDRICSIPSLTFQCQAADRNGNVLRFTHHIGWEYLEMPPIDVMSNFSHFIGNGMGTDRFETASSILQEAYDFSVMDCFNLLIRCRMTSPPTRVSLVFTPDDGTVYWCPDGNINLIESVKIK